MATAPVVPAAVYVGPNNIEGTNQTWSAGVMQRVVGDNQTLFGVSKTAGIWRFTARTQAWTQLRGPPKAFSITLDPKTPGRLVVGERSDDTTDEETGFSGLWQSEDSGDTWSFLYDPISQTSSQAVPAVAISPSTGTLFFATAKGVARWSAPQNPTTVVSLNYPATASGNITAIAIDTSRVWARTATSIMHSEDDGVNWESDTLNPSLALPEVGTLPAAYSGGSGSSDRNLSGISGKICCLIEPCEAFVVKSSSLIFCAIALTYARSDAEGSRSFEFFSWLRKLIRIGRRRSRDLERPATCAFPDF